MDHESKHIGGGEPRKQKTIRQILSLDLQIIVWATLSNLLQSYELILNLKLKYDICVSSYI